MDLSPGTRTRPDNARDRRANSGEAERWDKGRCASIRLARRQ